MGLATAMIAGDLRTLSREDVPNIRQRLLEEGLNEEVVNLVLGW
jgi:hypothetical protein